MTTNGGRRSNGNASGSPLGGLQLDNLAVVIGLDVHTGSDSPSAYPATASEPWPTVRTFWPGPPWGERQQWRWPSTPTSIRAMRLELRPLLERSGLPANEVEDLVVAAGEAASNAVEHAQLATLPYFDVCTEVGADHARIVIQDHGRWRPATAGGYRGRGLQMIGVLSNATLTVGARGTTVVLRNRPAQTG